MSRRALLGICVLAVIALVATVVTAYSIYQASQTGKKSRSALCQVLLYVRSESLKPQEGEPPLTHRQIERIDQFYEHVVQLVEGCHIPPKGTL